MSCGEPLCFDATSTDNCGPLTLFAHDQPAIGISVSGTSARLEFSQSFASNGPFSVTWDAVDGNGNAASCASLVQVRGCCEPAPANLVAWWPLDETGMNSVRPWTIPRMNA